MHKLPIKSKVGSAVKLVNGKAVEVHWVYLVRVVTQYNVFCSTDKVRILLFFKTL